MIDSAERSLSRSVSSGIVDPPLPGRVSVVMSTYHLEKPEVLCQSLESIYGQTVRPNQVVIVADGPIGEEQEELLRRFANSGRVDDTTIVRLPSNVGLAHALNAGLAACTGEYLMRMDSDDVSMADRLEIQLGYVKAHPAVDVVGSWSEEFLEDGTSLQLKASPITHAAVARALRWRNVLVHPTLLIRTDALRRIGGYRSSYGLLEDYDLFVRLVMSDANLHVIPKVLVRVRSSLSQRARRGGLKYCVQEVRFRTHLKKIGFLNWAEYFTTTLIYTTFRLVSGSARKQLYRLART